MIRTSKFVGALLAAAGPLLCVDTHAQARGPSAKEVQEKGQAIESSSATGGTRGAAFFAMLGFEPVSPPAPLDEASRASRNLEQAAWLARLPGRFLIGGRVEKQGFVDAGGTGVPVTMGGDISGVADCTAIGDGAGVHCLINATWRVIEPISGNALAGMMGPPPASERVGVLRPAVLVLGLNPDTAEIRASMVTDDSLAHTWAGRLAASTLIARRSSSCIEFFKLPRSPPPPCFQPIQIVAEPDSDIVTMVHMADGVTIKLRLQRDPTARAEKPMKTKKTR